MFVLITLVNLYEKVWIICMILNYFDIIKSFILLKSVVTMLIITSIILFKGPLCS